MMGHRAAGTSHRIHFAGFHRLLAVFFVTLTLIIASGGNSYASASRAATFAAQMMEAGLTETQAGALQAQIDELITAEGGTQIAANKVLWEDGRGATTIPLPGEVRVRDLAATLPNSHGGTHGTCRYLYLCTYNEPEMKGQMREYYYCEEHWNSTTFDIHSYRNNQTSGTRGVFRDTNYVRIHTTCAAYCYNSKLSNGSAVRYITPC